MGTKNVKELEELAGNGDVGAIYELGKRYYSGIGVEKDYNKARGFFEIASERGSNGANYYLGKIFYNGNGVETNHIKAKEYFEKSAKANNVFSTYYLGKIYYWGDGVEKDYNRANDYKNSILNKPLYKNQTAGLEEFYSVQDFEELTYDYATELQKQVEKEYKSLYGTEE